MSGWMDEAACRADAGTIWLFHSVEDYGLKPSGRGQEKALDQCKTVCLVCPARRQCEEYALTLALDGVEIAGVVGGFTPEERNELVQRARAS